MAVSWTYTQSPPLALSPPPSEKKVIDMYMSACRGWEGFVACIHIPVAEFVSIRFTMGHKTTVLK